jgi:hypothetical protein
VHDSLGIASLTGSAAQLRQKGHDLVLRKDHSALMGRGQAVVHNSKTGTNIAASGPRADGSAEAEPMSVR